MKTNIIFGLVGLVLGGVLVYGYQQYVWQPSIHEDLDLTAQEVIEIDHVSGDYYRVNVHHSENDGGGYYVIAKKLQNRHYMNIWRGQDTIPCSIMSVYGIPGDFEKEGCADW